MPLVPLITNSGPSASLYAPAGAGGGGSVPPNLTLSTLNVVGQGSVSSLSVSSINGAAPGGSVSPDLTLSTLNVVGLGSISSLSVSSINGAAPGGGGSALSTFNQLFTSTIECLNPASQNLIITGNDNNLVVDLETPLISRLRFTPSTSIGNGGGQGPFIKVEDQGSGNYTLSIQSDAAPALTTSISSLTVSSINNAAPGGGSAPFFSTLNSSPSTINCDGNTTQVLLSFSTTAGHFYQIQTQMTIQGNGGQEGTANDDVIQEVLNEIYLNTTQGSFISTANAAARDVGIGTCGMWKSNLTGTSLAINGTFSTTVQLGDVYLTDFGPV